MKVLVTGAAGFIGFHLSKRLLSENFEVIGLDNMNDYYSLNLKYARLDQLGINTTGIGSYNVLTKSDSFENFSFIQADLRNQMQIMDLFTREHFDVVVHLAGQAGVRYSIDKPHEYITSNVEGFLNILEGCRQNIPAHLIFASSSSVYGSNTEMPYKTSDKVDKPISLYAATKKANELMAYSYAHLFKIPVTGLRFFTVYGPWGRPDMAYYKFANLMNKGKSIDVYNHGKMARDFTYIDDIIESIFRLIPKPPQSDAKKSTLDPEHNGNGQNGAPGHAQVPYHLFNIGNGSPVNLLSFIQLLEEELEIESVKNYLPMQPGDVEKTWADVSELYEYISYKPQINIKEGIHHFADWYQGYYGATSQNRLKALQKELSAFFI